MFQVLKFVTICEFSNIFKICKVCYDEACNCVTE